jgi:hypothetical protein
MSRQAALFSELRTKPELLTPPGFRYQENVITEAAEAALVACLQTLDLKPFEFHGHLGNRRVISFGLRYDYSRRSVEAASESYQVRLERNGSIVFHRSIRCDIRLRSVLFPRMLRWSTFSLAIRIRDWRSHLESDNAVTRTLS